MVVLGLSFELGLDISVCHLGHFDLLIQLLDPERVFVFRDVLLHQIFLILILLLLIVNRDLEHFAFVFALHDFVLDDHRVLESVIELADVHFQLGNLLLLLISQDVQLLNLLHSTVKLLSIFLNKFHLSNRLCLLLSTSAFLLLRNGLIRLNQHLNNLTLLGLLVLNGEPELLDCFGEDLG